MKHKILIVEDDATLGAVLKERLLADYEVDWVTTQKQAEEIILKENYNLLILDIGLPDGNGFALAQKLVQNTRRPQFIFLTAQSDPESRLQGYELGAEEFIPKPFHLKELLIRVKHVLEAHVLDQQIELKNCSINLQNLSIHQRSGQIDYPPVKDMKILKLLIEKAPRILSRDEIINEVWGLEKDLSPRTIDNAIARLRQILSDYDESLIRSVRGIGYQWNLGDGGQS